MEQRKERRIAILCVSCVARPAKTIKGPLDTKCIPWHGDFDAQDNPLNSEGFKFMPGKRLCNFRDCVNPDHLDADSV